MKYDILDFLPSLLIVAGGVLNYLFSQRNKRKDRLICSYESMVKAYWELIGLAANNKLKSDNYYKTHKNTIISYVWAGKEICEKADVLSGRILEFSNATVDERDSTFKSCRDGLDELIALIRKEVGEPPRIETSKLFDVNLEP